MIYLITIHSKYFKLVNNAADNFIHIIGIDIQNICSRVNRNSIKHDNTCYAKMN
jgi:hypothetical protein